MGIKSGHFQCSIDIQCSIHFLALDRKLSGLQIRRLGLYNCGEGLILFAQASVFRAYVLEFRQLPSLSIERNALFLAETAVWVGQLLASTRSLTNSGVPSSSALQQLVCTLAGTSEVLLTNSLAPCVATLFAVSDEGLRRVLDQGSSVYLTESTAKVGKADSSNHELRKSIDEFVVSRW
jgi:hypothetical protein